MCFHDNEKKKIKHNDLYELQDEIVIDFDAKTSYPSIQESEFWFMHLGHIGERSSKFLGERNLLYDFVTNELNMQMLYLNKQWKVQFKTIIREIIEIAKLIHLDVCRLS